MTAYSVLAVTPTDDSWIPGYIEPVGKIIAKHGGKRLLLVLTFVGVKVLQLLHDLGKLIQSTTCS